MSENNLQGEEEKRIVKALQQGRQDVLNQLYDAYAPMMMGVISRIVPDQELAEQVLQETFMAIWSRIGVYDASQNRLLTWGLAIARGIALAAVKSGKYPPPATPKEAAQQLLEEQAKARSRRENDNLLCHLEPQERAALELIYLKGRSCAEAAAELGITEASLTDHIKTAFQHIKAEK